MTGDVGKQLGKLEVLSSVSARAGQLGQIARVWIELFCCDAGDESLDHAHGVGPMAVVVTRAAAHDGNGAMPRLDQFSPHVCLEWLALLHECFVGQQVVGPSHGIPIGSLLHVFEGGGEGFPHVACRAEHVGAEVLDLMQAAPVWKIVPMREPGPSVGFPDAGIEQAGDAGKAQHAEELLGAHAAAADAADSAQVWRLWKFRFGGGEVGLAREHFFGHESSWYGKVSRLLS